MLGRTSRHGRRRVWLYLLCSLIILFLIAPTVIVLPMSLSGGPFLQFPPHDLSFRWYEAYANSIEWRSATTVSLKVALLTVALSMPLGVAAAYGIERAGGRLATAILIALTSPMIIPVIFVGIGAFFLYARLNLLYTITGLVLAHVTLALPFVIALTLSALKGFDERQERAARSLGASRIYAFFTITLPQIGFSLAAAALLAFLTSFDEVIIAFLISGGENETLTRRMFLSLRDRLDPTIAAISSILILVSIVIVLLTQVLQNRRQD